MPNFQCIPRVEQSCFWEPTFTNPEAVMPRVEPISCGHAFHSQVSESATNTVTDITIKPDDGVNVSSLWATNESVVHSYAPEIENR